MALKFTSKEKRDALAERLAEIAEYMMRSMDQGHHGEINVSMEMADDIRLAACIVKLSEITSAHKLKSKGA